MTAVERVEVPLSRNRNYTLLWVGQACAEIGFSASMIAFPLLVLALTGSAAASGLVLAADAVAQLVVGLPAGALVDRWDRRRVMLACEAANVVALGSLVAVIVAGAATVPHMVAVAVVLGVCRALFEPAEDASLPSLVPDSQLATAISLNAARSSIGQMAGNALGGALFAVGRWVPFLLDLVTHFISFVALAFIRMPKRAPKTEDSHLGREIIEGMRWVLAHREVRVTAVCALALNFFFSAFYLVVIVLAERGGVSAAEIGIMAAMLGVGGIVGSLIAPLLHRVLSPYVSIVGVFWVLTVLAPLATLTDQGLLLGALFAGMALLAPTANTTITTHQLLLTPDELRGRLSGVMSVVVGGAAALGPALGGVLVEAVSPDTAVLVAAAGMAVVTLLVTINPTLRRYPGKSEREEATP
ncbi:MFS transporter [Actinokineospora cianjurensis]|uniref:Putative MFS family arabinose efflux permease n=1 Tax=Actinokineospora cianjurensis TaxID=585224 RepID=A0A421BBK7_9PSEU|nr:MFS transporter [Actinokineospora cianjurensis]RLK61739.1 putative MFS family arabinose efflux permease [Actinokineospora cianjurensis]